MCVSETGELLRVQSEGMKSILCDVILLQDVKVLSNEVVDLLETSSLNEEGHEETAVFLKD